MYCTLEQVKAAVNVTAPSYVDSQIVREISAASSIIDADMKRPQACFWPVTDTRYFDWLDHQYSLTWRLWLNGNDLAAAPTSVLSGGVDITSGVLARNGTDDSIPPFHYLEVNLASDVSFMATDSYQRAISVTGLYLACPPTEAAGGTLAAVNTSATSAVCSNGAALGVGSVIRVDTERMLVTDKQPTASGQTLQADLAATNAANTVAVSNGAVFFNGEVLTIDGEQMLITAVAGNNLLVKRAQLGTPLAQHTTGATVYVSRQLTLTRAALGTTAASHAANAPIAVHQVPAAVQTLALAETLRLLGIERAGYTMVIERGSLTKISTADTLWAQVRQPYQRKMRVRAPARHI
jgi:hypothetical protein